MADFNNFMKDLTQSIKNTEVEEVKVEVPPVVSPSVSFVSPSKIVKILIVSTHINQINGYSKVVYNLIKQLAQHPWMRIVHFGTQKLPNVDLQRQYPNRVKVIDASALDKDKSNTLGFGFTELPGVISSEKPDIVFIYNDLSVICAYVENIKKVFESRSFKIWAYADITYLSPPSHMIDMINRDVDRVFCFTKTWRLALKSQGITRPVHVMTHGVDTDVFKPMSKELARASLNLPNNVFLFTSLNSNIPRKRLDLLIISFAKLITKFPMKPIFMLIVADKGDRSGGFPLFDIFAREIKLNNASVDMFGNRLLVTDKQNVFSDDNINMLYNCADAGVSCADGEGFGLCSFEQMASGVPQIVPDINGYSEYCTSSNSQLVKPLTRYYIPQSHNSVTGEAQMVDTNDVCKAMERYVFDENVLKLHGKLAKETVTAYNWQTCISPMMKLLKRMIQDDDDDDN
jgi:glycosyltransferase involved in cell wall biosynthesis